MLLSTKNEVEVIIKKSYFSNNTSLNLCGGNNIHLLLKIDGLRQCI